MGITMSARVSAQPITLIYDLFPPPPPFQIPPPPASDLTSIATGDIDMPCRMSGAAHQGEDPLPPAPELQFQIAVGRYVGPTNPDGTLVHAAQMIQDGTLGPFAELTLVFYESILTNQLGGGCTPPRHRLMYNGQWLAEGDPGEPGAIQSFGRGWRSHTFRVPISWVRFPAEPGPEPGIAPTPAVNNIHIAWDPVTPLALACNTCMAVSSMSQRTRVVSPVILIHGNSLDLG